MLRLVSVTVEAEFGISRRNRIMQKLNGLRFKRAVIARQATRFRQHVLDAHVLKDNLITSETSIADGLFSK